MSLVGVIMRKSFLANICASFDLRKASQICFVLGEKVIDCRIVLVVPTMTADAWASEVACKNCFIVHVAGEIS